MPTESTDEAVHQVRADYDATPYLSDSIPLSAPGHLAAVAHLFNLRTPRASESRVLEIGCAAGGNIIPFAAVNPDAHVVGVDLSGSAIEQGRRCSEAIGLQNIELIEGDIATVDFAALGQFDYVIAHGVYSWVPDNVQDALLSASSTSLAPEGVAYVSYNVYPGWKSKEMVRDAMLFACRNGGPAEQQVDAARRMVDFLEEVAPPATPLARALVEFRERDDGSGDWLLVHDELARFNQPCYFVDILQRAGAHGLAFLAEARPELMFPGNYGPKVAEHVLSECGGAQPLIEQYLDFAADRAFRQTLFVHAERAQDIQYSMDSSKFKDLHFAADITQVDGPARLDESAQNYQLPGGATLSTGDPVVKLTLDALAARSPWTLSRHALVDAVTTRLGSATSAAAVEDQIDQLLGFLIVNGQSRYRLEAVSPKPLGERPHLHDPFRRLAVLT